MNLSSNYAKLLAIVGLALVLAGCTAEDGISPQQLGFLLDEDQEMAEMTLDVFEEASGEYGGQQGSELRY